MAYWPFFTRIEIWKIFILINVGISTFIILAVVDNFSR
jgi:hypothetical protein